MSYVIAANYTVGGVWNKIKFVKILNEDEMSIVFNNLPSILISAHSNILWNIKWWWQNFYNATRFVKVFTSYVFAANFTVGGVWNKIKFINIRNEDEMTIVFNNLPPISIQE